MEGSARKRVRSSRYLTQSCERCFSLKKKCDRESPCGRCARSRSECRYTSSLNQRHEINDAKAFNDAKFGCQLDMSVRRTIQAFDRGEDPGLIVERLKQGYSEITANSQSPSYLYTPLQNLGNRSTAVKFARAYFKAQHILIPFLDVGAWCQAFDVAYQNGGKIETHQAYLIYMVLATGALIENFAARDVEPEGISEYYEAAQGLNISLTKACAHQWIERMILKIGYSLYDPNSSPSYMWDTLSKVLCEALALGYHNTSSSQNYETEGQKRVFWSLYNLDRLINLLLGRPTIVQDEYVTITLLKDNDSDFDHSVNVGLPSADQINAIVRFSRIEGYIHRRVSTQSTDLIGASERPSLLDLKGEADWWFENVKPLFVGSISYLQLLELYYYNLVALTLRPSPSFPATPPELMELLLDSLHKKIYLCYDLLVNAKVHWNWLFLYGTMRAAIVLLYVHFNSTLDTNIAFYLSLVHKTFDAYPKGWSTAHKAGQSIERISQEFSYGNAEKAGLEIRDFLNEIHGSGSVYSSGNNLSDYETMTSLLADWFELVGKLDN